MPTKATQKKPTGAELRSEELRERADPNLVSVSLRVPPATAANLRKLSAARGVTRGQLVAALVAAITDPDKETAPCPG